MTDASAEGATLSEESRKLIDDACPQRPWETSESQHNRARLALESRVLDLEAADADLRSRREQLHAIVLKQDAEISRLTGLVTELTDELEHSEPTQ